MCGEVSIQNSPTIGDMAVPCRRVYYTNTFTKCADIGLTDRFAQNAHGSGGDEHLPGERAHESGLTAAVRSKDGCAGAGGNSAGNTAQDRRIASHNMKVIDFNRG